VAINNLKAYRRNINHPTVKQEHTFIIITGGSGSGKTRAALEIGHSLRSSQVR